MMNSDLKPCPFCGGADIKGGGDDKCVGFGCLTCGAMGPNQYATGRDWNTRTEATAREDGTRVRLYFPDDDVSIGGMLVQLDDENLGGSKVTWFVAAGLKTIAGTGLQKCCMCLGT